MYAEQTLTRLINERVMAYEAERLGFEVTPKTCCANLQVMAPMLFQNGSHRQGAIRGAAARTGSLHSEFEASTRVQLLVSKLATW